jgi:hypothetical protein
LGRAALFGVWKGRHCMGFGNHCVCFRFLNYAYDRVLPTLFG